MTNRKRLEGRIAIVTGASRQKGIGTAICRAFAEEGADILFTHWRTYDRIMEWDWPDVLSSELRQFGVRVESIELDLSDRTSPAHLLDIVETRLGSPSILVNNATHCAEVNFRSLTVDVLDAHYAVNVRGACILSVEFCQRLKARNGGRIINLISGQDKTPMPGNIAYETTKGAISIFTQCLAREVAHLGITVNAVDPGPTDSGWMTDKIKDFLLPKFPTGRIGEPEDAASLITFLASEEAQWITGQIIHSDGGFWD